MGSRSGEVRRAGGPRAPAGRAEAPGGEHRGRGLLARLRRHRRAQGRRLRGPPPRRGLRLSPPAALLPLGVGLDREAGRPSRRRTGPGGSLPSARPRARGQPARGGTRGRSGRAAARRVLPAPVQASLAAALASRSFFLRVPEPVSILCSAIPQSIHCANSLPIRVDRAVLTHACLHLRAAASLAAGKRGRPSGPEGRSRLAGGSLGEEERPIGGVGTAIDAEKLARRAGGRAKIRARQCHQPPPPPPPPPPPSSSPRMSDRRPTIDCRTAAATSGPRVSR